MSLQNVSNHKQLLIGKKDISAAVAAGTLVTPSSIEAGEIVLTTVDGYSLSSASSAVNENTQLVIVQGQGSTLPLIKSTPFTPKSIFVAKKKAYIAAAQQISTVGYNGTSGNIVNPGVGISIILRNTFKTNFYQFSDKLMESIVGYKVTAADTIFTLADALTKRAIQDIQKYVNIPFKAERLSNGTYGTTTASVAATKSSSVLTGTGVGTANPVGTRVRIGASNATTTPVYVVTAASANSITIDTAYQGATATVNVYTNTVAPTSIGIQFTGLPQAKFAPNIFRYETSKFVTTATNFSTTEVINAAQVPTEGSGVYEQIAEEEFFFQLGEGMHDNALIQIPPVTMRTNVSTSGTYSIIDLEVSTQSGTMSFINNPMARKQIRVAFDVSGGTTEYAELENALEAVCGITIS